MPLLSRFRSVWNTLANKDRLDHELDEEISAAVETLASRYIADGMEPERARRAAVRSLGGIERVKESVREARLGAGLDALLLDSRYAWRGLRNAPGFAAVVLVTLALGIGANTAIFSVVHAVLLEPLPYPDAERLVFIWLQRKQAGYTREPISGPDLRDLRERTKSLEAIGGIWATGSITLTSDHDPEQIRAAQVTTDFFEVLRVGPALGRTFRPDDSLKGAQSTVVLGWDLFERRFGGDSSLIGRTISIDANPVRVIGVMPRGFRLLLPMDSSVPDHLQAWTPFWPELESGPRGTLFLRVVARMRPGVSLGNVRDEVNEVARTVSREIGRDRAFTVVGLQDDGVRDIRGPLLALFIGVGILLAIACVNVASLLIARAASRAREISVRLALGATSSRLLRQSFVEGLLLTLLGAASGVVAGYGSLQLLLALSPPSLSRLQTSQIDTTVFAFTIAISVFWGVLFFFAPITELFKTAIVPVSNRTTAAPIRYRVRAGLIALQVALSTMLLVSAGLLVHGFINVLRVEIGFRAHTNLTFRLAVPGRFQTRDSFNGFAADLQRRLAAIPGVTGVGAVSHLPYDDLPNWALPYSLESPVPTDAPMVNARAVSPGLFETLGVQRVEGRFFTDEDRHPKAAVVIVDDLFARQHWPGQSALGRSFFTRPGQQQVTVVGVVRHLRLRSVADDLAPQIFLPWALAQRNPIAFVLGTNVGDPTTLIAQVQAAVTELDPRLPIYEPKTLQAYVDDARSTRRFTMLLAAAFAITALALTAVGIYGVFAYAVARRRHEFDVRRALGADARQITGTVLKEGLTVTLAGCAGGLAGAVMAGRWLQSQLYAVQPDDLASYGVAITLILGGSLVACLVPAYRATAVSPMDTLRTE